MDLFTDSRDIVHIRVQQRNGRKCLTLIHGLANDLDLKKIIRYLKKVYSTNGHVSSDSKYGDIIQLQGDQRKNVYEAFIEWKVCEKEELMVHGS
jgi:translation initiation factor 1